MSGSTESGSTEPGAVSGSVESSMRERVTASVSVFIQRAPGLARQHPLECAAVILLGLGGLIFPPIWLLGALVALPSRLWDIKDKLTGLALPAVVAIVGGAGLAMGSSHTTGGAYFHEALNIGGYLIRAGAVLGAVLPGLARAAWPASARSSRPGAVSTAEVTGYETGTPCPVR